MQQTSGKDRVVPVATHEELQRRIAGAAAAALVQFHRNFPGHVLKLPAITDEEAVSEWAKKVVSEGYKPEPGDGQPTK